MRFYLLGGAAIALAAVAFFLIASKPEGANAEINVAAVAEEAVLNLYSARHYDTDQRLYSDFTEATGIQINRLEDSASALMARIQAEGANSPADILMTTDIGRLWAAEEADLFQEVSSNILESRIPAKLRDPDGQWFAFSQRARVIFYDKARVDPADLQTYADLADPRWEGMICTRSSSNIYMLSLMAAQIHHMGEDAARAWATGLWNNRARDPEGGDTDQLRGIASGQCAIAVANTYYFARALRREVRGLANPEDTSRIGVIFPNQQTTGAHVNVSGGGILAHAPHPENARLFLEYLASDSAQAYFSAGNDEYPAVEDAPLAPSVASLGEFEADDLMLIILGQNQRLAQEIYDEVGYR